MCCSESAVVELLLKSLNQTLKSPICNFVAGHCLLTVGWLPTEWSIIYTMTSNQAFVQTAVLKRSLADLRVNRDDDKRKSVFLSFKGFYSSGLHPVWKRKKNISLSPSDLIYTKLTGALLVEIVKYLCGQACLFPCPELDEKRLIALSYLWINWSEGNTRGKSYPGSVQCSQSSPKNMPPKLTN